MPRLCAFEGADEALVAYWRGGPLCLSGTLWSSCVVMIVFEFVVSGLGGWDAYKNGIVSSMGE